MGTSILKCSKCGTTRLAVVAGSGAKGTQKHPVAFVCDGCRSNAKSSLKAFAKKFR